MATAENLDPVADQPAADTVVQQNANEGTNVVLPADAVEEVVIPTEPEVPLSIKLRNMVMRRIALRKLTNSMWTESHIQLIDQFLATQSLKLLCAYIDPRGSFVIMHQVPNHLTSEMFYFLRVSNSAWEQLNTGNFNQALHYGLVQPDHLQSLLSKISSMFCPMFFNQTTWPDTVKNELFSHLHKFLSSLTDTRWKMESKTVLYVPMEGSEKSIEQLAKDKEFVQRMESVTIHWTRQIKEMLSAQDSVELQETNGPLDELDFWKSRCDDLSSLSVQLDNPQIKRITEILSLAKSSYIAPFTKLASQIKDGSKQAESNLKFLTVLRDPCYELAEASPDRIPFLLPKILNLVRMIWNNSDYYNSRERLTGMLRKISNEVIRRCCASISLDQIFDGFVVSSTRSLKNCISCCEQWKEIYDTTAKLHQAFSKTGWLLDKQNIFAQIDAFMQRCRDLLEVCECERFFARMGEGAQTEMPLFAGERGPEIQQSLVLIEVAFQKHLAELRLVKDTILNVKSSTWHEDYNKFRMAIKDLEVMMQNVINAAFETVRTVDHAVEVLDVFMHLATRESIRRTLDKKTTELCRILKEEIDAVKRELIEKRLLNSMTDIPLSPAQAHWARLLKRRLERQMMILDRGWFLPQIGMMQEVRYMYQQVCKTLDDLTRKVALEWKQTPYRIIIELFFNRSDKSETC